MYNERQKETFIRYRFTSIEEARDAVELFELSGKHEQIWNSDICTQNKDNLEVVVNEINRVRGKKRGMMISTLGEYLEWCVTAGIEGARNEISEVDILGLDVMRFTMVSSPAHLKKCLDEIFDPAVKETLDVTFRCYFWMAFAGMKEEDALLVSKRDIDFSSMCIKYKGYEDIEIPIYREAIDDFKNAALLTAFNYEHPMYTDIIRRDRVPGEEIMRSIKGQIGAKTIRVYISRKNLAKINSGATKHRLAFRKIYLSGLFYRMYEREKIYGSDKINFNAEAERHMQDITYTLKNGMTLKHKKTALAKKYKEQYQRWKLTFSI